jgi:hypothetical protein
MQTFGEMAICAQNSDKKTRNKLADRGYTVMFVGYSEFHENDVYKFWNLATNRTLISRYVIWLNKTYSEHMDITKVNIMTSEVEEEEDGGEQEPNEEQEGPFDLPSTVEENHTESLVDATATAKPSIIPVPRSTRELRSLSYGTVGPAQKKLSRELRGPQSKNIYIAYINKQVKADIQDKEYLMLGAAFNSISGFDD